MGISYIPIRQGTGSKIATIKKTENSNTVHVQKFVYDTDNLELVDVLANTSIPGTSSVISTLGFSKLIVNLLYSASDVTANIIIKLCDANSNCVYTQLMTIANTGINLLGTYYNGEVYITDCAGFTEAYIILVDSPTNGGTVTIQAGVV